LTVRCFYVVQKRKGVADAMIEALFPIVSIEFSQVCHCSLV
jgi:hypothetical protein